MNRENRARLRAIRDNLHGLSTEIDEILNEIEPTEEKTPEKLDITPDTTNWTSADEKPDKAGIYMKDLNESTILKDMKIVGQISVIGDTTTFTRKTDGSDGRVKNFILQDSSGEMLVVFWDEQVDKVSQFMLGDKVEITNAWQVKRNKKGILELHPGKFFSIKRVE